MNRLIKEFFYLLVEEFFVYMEVIDMAENLLCYGFSREDGQAVGNVLTEVQNLISR